MRYTTGTRGRDGVIHALTVMVLVALAMLTLAALAPAQSTQPIPTVTYAPGGGGKVAGIIVARQGDDILLRDDATKSLSVITLVPGTRITTPTGFLKLDRKSQNVTSLIPGLIIAVNGSGGNRGNLIADRISFKKEHHTVAAQINAGEVELKAANARTANKAAANADSIEEITARARAKLDSLDIAIKTRMSELDTYDVRETAVVNFATGKSELSPEAKVQLDQLALRGTSLQNYIIEVVGFTDNEGNAEMNRLLSEARADAVVAYLADVQSVPLRRIVNPTGLGEAKPVAPNDTPVGRAENRRVEVKVLVNRGIPPR